MERLNATEQTARAFQLNRRSGTLAIIALGLALYIPAIDWGLPNTASWSQDTIAADRTFVAVGGWPDEWRGRYAPLHYIVLRGLYAVPLAAWSEGTGWHNDEAQNLVRLHPPFEPRLTTLLYIARFTSVAMAIGAGLGVYFAARRLTRDDLSALLASVVLMIGADFAYFARLGNVDVPSMFWFAWSLYFFVRAMESLSWRDCLFLGLLGSAAISTKDSIAGAYPGMAIVLLYAQYLRVMRTGNGQAVQRQPHGVWHRLTAGGKDVWHRLTAGESERADGPHGRKLAHKAERSRGLKPAAQENHVPRRPAPAVQIFLQRKWLVGIAAFALPYLFINGAFTNWDGYVTRIQYWLGITEGTLHAAQHRYTNQGTLLLASLWYGASAVGWPMLTAMIAAVAYAIVQHRRIALALLLPAISYYLIIIAPQGFVYARFLFPVLALLAILLGIAGAALLRNGDLPASLRIGLPVTVLTISLGYACSITAEMMIDSRYDAEEWFAQNVEDPADVGVFSKPQYLPRLARDGSAGVTLYMLEFDCELFSHPLPECLVLTSYNYEDFDEQQAQCLERLLKGELGYQTQATFSPRFLGTGSSWLSLAGWGTPTPGKISPRIIVMRRQ